MDVINHSEWDHSPIFCDDIILIETAIMQFSWRLQRFKENKKTVTENFLQKGKGG